jgi:putative membrane protein
MSQQPSDGDLQRFEVRLTADSHFSWLRTKLSMDRTLMAAERTAVAMIGFGFTIVQFFERFGDMDGVHLLRPQMPRYIGLALIAAGTLTMAISIWQYRQGVGYLWRDPYRSLAGIKDKEILTPTYFLAFVLLFIGIFVFLALLLRAF